MTTPVLPIVTSCDGCGACCRHMVFPPFLAWYAGLDPSWDRLERERPDLVADIHAAYQKREAARMLRAAGNSADNNG